MPEFFIGIYPLNPQNGDSDLPEAFLAAEKFDYDPSKIKYAEQSHIIKRGALLRMVTDIVSDPVKCKELLGYSINPPIKPETYERLAKELEVNKRVIFRNE